MTRTFVFGPVASRRLGRSLGVDPVPSIGAGAPKTCNWNCVYCQLGRTVPVTNERRDHAPVGPLLDELRAELARLGPDALDRVTIVGSGEPTLHAHLGDIVRGAQRLTSVPVAVLTNGALLWRPEVRDALVTADCVLPSLDAGNATLHRRIHRGHPELTFERHVDGLVAFRREYPGRIWLEVMLVRGLNDGEAALRELADVVARVAPDEVHLNSPTRPPAEPWVAPTDDEGMLRARALLGTVAHVVVPVAPALDLSGEAAPCDAIVAVVVRHPIDERDLAEILERSPDVDAAAVLDSLARDPRVKRVERHGARFWTARASVHRPASAPSLDRARG